MHFHFDVIADHEIVGFCTESVTVAPGKTVNVQILSRGLFTSDDKDFYRYMDSFSDLFLHPKGVMSDSIHQFLMIIHEGGSGDLYVNDFQVNIDIKVKQVIEKGSIVMLSDVADILKVHFPHVTIKDTDKIVYCFKVGWRFGLYFDLSTGTNNTDPNNPKVHKLNIEKTESAIGGLRRYLMFYHVYKTLETEDNFQTLMNDGWFPFIELLSGEYKILGEIYQDKNGFENRIVEFVNKFTEARIKKISDRWWDKQVFLDKNAIIEAGINAFLQNTSHGNINAIKNLLTEIEGVLRKVYHLEIGNGKRITAIELISHIIEKGRKKSLSDASLFFPEMFLAYLRDIIFAHFDMNGSTTLSRNSSSHGVANGDQYTRTRALQAILVLDQIHYYI